MICAIASAASPRTRTTRWPEWAAGASRHRTRASRIRRSPRRRRGRLLARAEPDADGEHQIGARDPGGRLESDVGVDLPGGPSPLEIAEQAEDLGRWDLDRDATADHGDGRGPLALADAEHARLSLDPRPAERPGRPDADDRRSDREPRPREQRPAREQDADLAQVELLVAGGGARVDGQLQAAARQRKP